MISRMCLSDLHLGDARSVLSSPKTCREVAWRMALLAGEPGPGGERPECDTLILNGDVWEECVPSGMGDELPPGALFEEAVLEASRAFFGAVLDAVDVRRIVWVPGNHDLCLWHLYSRMLGPGFSSITSYGGHCHDVKDERWRRVFGTLLGREVAAHTTAYPLFVETPWAGGFPHLAFTHGHLLDPLVRGLEPDLVYLALRAIGCRQPRVPADLREVNSAAEIALVTDHFSLALWERYSRRDHAFSNYVLRRLNDSRSCPLQEATSPGQVAAVTQASDPSSPRDGLLAQVPWFLDVLVADPGLPSPVGELRTHNPGPTYEQPSCLVYGHDHQGGSRVVTSSGVPYAAVDAGGWTSEHDGHHPHSHVLVWRAPGQVVPEAYLLHTRLGEGG